MEIPREREQSKDGGLGLQPRGAPGVGEGRDIGLLQAGGQATVLRNVEGVGDGKLVEDQARSS